MTYARGRHARDAPWLTQTATDMPSLRMTAPAGMTATISERGTELTGYVRDAADRVLSRGGAGPDTQAMLLRLADSTAGGMPVTQGRQRPPWDAALTRTDLRALTDDPPATVKAGHPGWVTVRHRIQVAVTVTLITAVFYVGQHLLWPHSPVPHGWLARTWSWAGVLWAVPFIPGAFELAGLLLWRAPRSPAAPVPYLVCWRIVSRGLNKEALRDTIMACRLEMDRTPLFRYVIEVVLIMTRRWLGCPARCVTCITSACRLVT